MTFSWSYEDLMRRFSTRGSLSTMCSYEDAQTLQAYALMLKFDFNRNNVCEVPTYVCNYMSQLYNIQEDTTIVIPLSIGTYIRQVAGTDTLLRHLDRSNGNGRLIKVTTSKGEVYYGNNGILLDKDLSPLLFITEKVSFNPETLRFDNKGYNVRLSPKVFTDDDKMLNKALAKKGIAYYLSHSAANWGDPIPYNVIIDDCSSFFSRPNRPDVNNCSNSEFTATIKDNIAEVLKQVDYDASGIIL